MRVENFAVMIVFVVFALAACAPRTPTLPPSGDSPDDPVVHEPGEPTEPIEPPAYLPKPEDADLAEGRAFIDEFQILVLESFPPQYRLNIKGNLPTPCHALRVKVNEPKDGEIVVDVYSVSDPEEICVQVLEPFEVTVSLDGFAPGVYQVLVNGEDAGSIDVPQPVE